MAVSLYALQRNPEVWKDPDVSTCIHLLFGSCFCLLVLHKLRTNLNK